MFHKKIKEVFNHHGFPLTSDQLEQFAIYKSELKLWNTHMNLTTIHDDNEIIYKHFLDSISVLAQLKISGDDKVIDIGTGAGFPGVAIKIYIPSISLTLVEVSQKKVAFLKYLVSKLAFDSSPKILALRAENCAATKENKNAYDWVLTRYVASLQDSVAYCLPLLNSTGRWIAYKSSRIELEIKHSRKFLRTFGAEIERIYASEIEKLDRNFVVLRKVS